MKLFITTLVFVLSILEVSAQYPKLLVQLKDKGASKFSLSAPGQYLSQRALQRRQRYNIPVDSLDLPVTAAYLDSIRQAGKVVVLSSSRWLNQVLVETTDPEALSKIQSFPFVKTVQGIGYRSITVNSDDKFRESITTRPAPATSRTAAAAANSYDYGSTYPQVHMHEGEFLHNKGFRGENMQVAVLDAGFQQYKHLAAFDSIRLLGQVLGERDFVAFDNSVNEDDSHGMHCLSILSANWPGKMTGTAPKANYWLLRTENAASEYMIEEYNWVTGAEFADSTGSDIISSSLGYSTFDAPAFNHSYSELYKNTTLISRGAAVAARKGLIVCVSAGNEGNNSWKYITFPADADSVCAVGAVNSAGVMASFSSLGYPGKTKPNIVSFGAGTIIAGLDNLPIAGNGTSYSNPNVTGLIACLWQAFPKVSNMKLLEAVYKSADKYASPDNRYGYGIPNFRIAYQLLKHEENLALYGNEWLFVTPTPFTTSLDIKFIGKTDGLVTLSLVNSAGQVVGSHQIEGEKEEVYNYTFSNLSNLPSGLYSLKFSDSTITRIIQVQKGNIFEKDWLVALPNPFNNEISVFIKAQETGEIRLRLVDTKGGIIETASLIVTEQQNTTHHFREVGKLPAGVFFLQYIGRTQKRTLRLFKG